MRRTRRQLIAEAAAGLALAAAAGCRGGGSPGTAAGPGSSVASTPPATTGTAGPRASGRFLYVFPDGELQVFDTTGFGLVKRLSLPPTQAGTRGCCASARTGRLYLSYGGDGHTAFGEMLAYDLRHDRIVWTRTYPVGIDSMAIAPDGSTIYLPTGERADPGESFWHVVDAADGSIRGRIPYGTGPHNTVVSLDGARVYLGARNTDRLAVASTRSLRVERTIGPLAGGVRPFTINGAETLAFTTATRFLGFQVSSIERGGVLYTVDLTGLGFAYDPGAFAASAPSHGISLAPDEGELYVMDAPNSMAHVFDVSQLPSVPPRMTASIRLTSMTGRESPCRYDCQRDGWLCHSRDGRRVYVGDSGDVIDTRSRRILTTLDGLRNTRKYLEIGFRDGTPVYAQTSRAGVGYRS